MRPIEFRGLRVDGMGWAYGFIGRVQNDDSTYDYLISEDTTRHQRNVRRCVFTVHPESVGQFTGLYDKNGVKIWEGDVVRYHFQNAWHRAEMIFNNGAFRIKGWGHGELTHTFEVAGNIHEQKTSENEPD